MIMVPRRCSLQGPAKVILIRPFTLLAYGRMGYGRSGVRRALGGVHTSTTILKRSRRDMQGRAKGYVGYCNWREKMLSQPLQLRRWRRRKRRGEAQYSRGFGAETSRNGERERASQAPPPCEARHHTCPHSYTAQYGILGSYNVYAFGGGNTRYFTHPPPHNHTHWHH